MSTIRPPIFPTQQQPAQGAGAAKGSAQRAFFEAAFGRPAAAQATAAPQTDAPTAAPAQKIPANLPADPPQKILRPGSLLDIRV